MYSKFGGRFAAPSGTRELMDDLGQLALGGAGLVNLGGGNPSRIPAVEEALRAAWASVPLDDWMQLAAVYDAPQGYQPLLRALAEFLRERCGWPVGAGNLLLTTGSQSAFFSLFNLFGGQGEDGRPRQILLPQAPEYIGYAESPIEPATLVSCPSRIELLGAHRFKYHPDFEGLPLGDTTAAICLSRPCNPTGNVIGDEDFARLRALARNARIPLIVDCAYGMPFPGISFVPSSLVWDEELVICLSFSKLGLPGFRAGLIVAREDIIDVLTSMNAMLTLAPNPVGARLMLALLAREDVLQLGEKVIGPHYAARSRLAQAIADEALAGLDYRLHVSEGAIFLWAWFSGLRQPVQVLYERLKARGVLVIPGHHFGPGLVAPWPHLTQCVRLSYAQDETTLRRGLSILAEEVRALS